MGILLILDLNIAEVKHTNDKDGDTLDKLVAAAGGREEMDNNIKHLPAPPHAHSTPAPAVSPGGGGLRGIPGPPGHTGKIYFLLEQGMSLTPPHTFSVTVCLYFQQHGGSHDCSPREQSDC